MRRRRAPIAAVVLLAAAAGCAGFEPLPFSEEQPPAVFASPTHALPGREEVHYLATWNGLPAGRAKFVFERAGPEIRGFAEAATAGLVRLVYGVGVKAEGTLRPRDGRSIAWGFRTDGAKEEKRVESRFDPDSGAITADLWKGEKHEVRRMTDAAARDPFSVIEALRTIELTAGARLRFDVFTEWFLYRMDAEIGERERIRSGGAEIDVVRIRLDVRKVRDGVPEGKSHGVAVWVSADARQCPVRIEADTRYGRVALSLVEYRAGWPRVTAGRGWRPAR